MAKKTETTDDFLAELDQPDAVELQVDDAPVDATPNTVPEDEDALAAENQDAEVNEEQPPKEVVIDPDFASKNDVSEVRVAVGGLSNDAELDEDGRFTVSESPQEVPAKDAAVLAESPAVKVVE